MTATSSRGPSIRPGCCGASRRGRERLDQIDWPNIIDEVETVGRSERSAVRSLIGTVPEHLMKLQASPARDSRNGWKDAVNRARRDIDHVLKNSPSLRRAIATMITGETPATVRLVGQSLALFGERPRVDVGGLAFTEEQGRDQERSVAVIRWKTYFGTAMPTMANLLKSIHDKVGGDWSYTSGGDQSTNTYVWQFNPLGRIIPEQAVSKDGHIVFFLPAAEAAQTEMPGIVGVPLDKPHQGTGSIADLMMQTDSIAGAINHAIGRRGVGASTTASSPESLMPSSVESTTPVTLQAAILTVSFSHSPTAAAAAGSMDTWAAL